jgi:hypothetical protein
MADADLVDLPALKIDVAVGLRKEADRNRYWASLRDEGSEARMTYLARGNVLDHLARQVDATSEKYFWEWCGFDIEGELLRSTSAPKSDE